MTTTTKATNTATNTAAVEAEVPAVETQTAAELVEQVKEKAALKNVKASVKRDWVSIIGAGAMAGVASAANMIVENMMAEDLEQDRRYSSLDIAGVSVATAVVGSGVRAALDFIPQVHNDDTVALITTSIAGNMTFVASAMVRDAALDMLRGKVAVDIEGLAEEA